MNSGTGSSGSPLRDHEMDTDGTSVTRGDVVALLHGVELVMSTTALEEGTAKLHLAGERQEGTQSQKQVKLELRNSIIQHGGTGKSR